MGLRGPIITGREYVIADLGEKHFRGAVGAEASKYKSLFLFPTRAKLLERAGDGEEEELRERLFGMKEPGQRVKTPVTGVRDGARGAEGTRDEQTEAYLLPADAD